LASLQQEEGYGEHGSVEEGSPGQQKYKAEFN